MIFNFYQKKENQTPRLDLDARVFPQVCELCITAPISPNVQEQSEQGDAKTENKKNNENLKSD